MLSQIKGERKTRKIATYDFEWIPGKMEIRIAGFQDEKRYYSFYSIPDFLNHVLTERYKHYWIFAHFGGRADLLFVLEEIAKNDDYTVEGRMSGSSCVIAEVRKGDRKWIFIDSFWLFRTSLAKIAEPLGMGKTGPEFDDEESDAKVKEWYATVPMEELREYNANDCDILYQAIKAFEKVLNDMGGELMMTIASCAMRLFRRVYLQETIQTHPGINQRAVSAYCASRVEVIQPVAEKGYVYDLNSSFPFAMTFPLPGKCLSINNRIPDDESLYMADCDIHVPDHINIPPLPYRDRFRLFFPVGSWRCWFTSVDLEVLQNAGGWIDNVYQVATFEKRDDFKNYAMDIYQKRKGDDKTEFEKIVYKYLLNSLYGKLNESEDKSQLILNPSAQELSRLRLASGDDPHRTRMLYPGCWVKTESVDIPHQHLPGAAFITSIARRTLYGHMVLPMDELHYCDTDCLSTDRKDLPVSNELGGLKIEDTFDNAQYLAPKLYHRLKPDGSHTYKAKGFSLGKNDKKRAETWQTIIEGRDVKIERMLRIREMLANPEDPDNPFKPMEKTFTKRFVNASKPKRSLMENGKTRPWSIEELS